MKQFLARSADSILCVPGCFDRLLFKGCRPISHPASMERWLASRGLLLKDFKRFVTTQSEKLRLHAQRLAQQAGHPYLYLRRPIRKDDEARRIAERDGLSEGLSCVFAILEQAQSFQLRYGEGKPQLIATQPRCFCFYFYYLDRDFGLMRVRLQTWFPFTVQIYSNGHSWLEHATLRFSVEDVMSFLGRKLHRQCAGEARTESKRRWPGARGEHRLRGFRAAHVAHALGWSEARDPAERKRHSARLNRQLRLLRAHGLIARISHSCCWRATAVGVTHMSAILHLQTQPLPTAKLEMAA